MARIPDDELRRLKAEVDLVALVRASGVDLSPCGEEMRGLCPFHEEKTPSFSVNREKGLFRCWGCNAAGSAIDFVMKTHPGVSFRHAVELLRSWNGGAGGPLAPVKDGVRRGTPLQASPLVRRDATDQQLLNQVVDYYHRTLAGDGAEALAYLSKRGLASSEMIDRFKLGFANNTLGYRLPKKTWKEGQEVRLRLASIGLMRDTGHEFFGGAIVAPILDPENGNILGVYGRRVSDGSLREGQSRHLYLKGPHRGVWNVEAFSASKEVTLCESAFDALSFWAHGHRAVTWAYGVQGFTDEMLAAMTRHGTERVFLAYDADEAGDRAAEELAPRLAEAGIEVRRVVFAREVKDANEYVQRLLASGADVSHNLGVLVREAHVMVAGRRSTAVSIEPPAAVSLGPSVAVPSEPSASQGEGPEAPRALEPPPAPAATPASFPAASTSPPAADEAAKGEGSGGHGGSAPPPEPPCDPSPAAAGPQAGAPPFAAPPLEAAPPLLEAAPPSLVVRGDQADLVLGDRAYRVGNLTRNLSPNAMRVMLRVSRKEKVHVDTLELLSDRARQLYIKRAAEELGVEPETVKKDLAKLLLALEEVQGQRIGQVLAPKSKHVEIPEEEKAEAFALLRNPRLLSLVVEGLSRVGLVGEETNKLIGYLAATSRKLAEPLAVLVQSNSAAGKSTLMDAVLEVMPPEEVERFTAMTGQSLYYLADSDLKHKVLAIAEVEGAERAGYAIKCLQSEGKISIATTVKDPETGEMKTKKHEVEGPVAVFLTTTEAEVDEELQNRAVVLTVNEDREQTRAIHEAQRHAQTLAGILAREEREAVVRLHRNAQRLLRPLRVVNPFAEGLTFESSRLRTRRDHVKYLTLIQAIALLHQYQRSIREMSHRGRMVPYIEATLADVEVATRLANDAIGRSLDEMAPQTRRLLLLVDEMVSARCAERKIDREDYRFTRREVRESTQWSDTQLWKHLSRLVELEHVLAHPGGRGHSYVYELVYDGQGKDGRRFVVGLIDPKRLSPSATKVDLTPSKVDLTP